MKKSHLLLLTVCFFAIQIKTSGQTRANFEFKTLTEEDGLSRNIVTCFAQDDCGFMWIGTQEGLNRYDGNHFEILRRTNDGTPTLPSNHIQCLLFDHLGYLWIGTRNAGLCRYDPRKNEFFVPEFFDAEGQSVSNTAVFHLQIKDNKFIYAATSTNGILQVDLNSLKTNTLSVTIPESEGKELNIHDLFVTDSCLWLGTYNYGLLKYIPGMGVVERYTGIDSTGFPKFKEIVRVIEGTYPYLWISSESSHVTRFNLITKTSEAFNLATQQNQPSNTSFDMFMQGKDSLLIGSSDGVLKVLHIPDKKVELISSLGDNEQRRTGSLVSIFRSKEGILWLGTNGNGLAYHHPGLNLFEVYSKFKPTQKKVDVETIKSIEVDEKYLFAGGYYGLNRINHATQDRALFLPNKAVLSLATNPSDRNTLIVGCGKGPLIFLDKNTGEMSQFPLPENTSVHSITPSNEHQFLLGTSSGMYVYDHKLQRLVKHYEPSGQRSGIPSGTIKSIIVDSQKRIWVGSTNRGLSQFSTKTEIFTKFDSLNKQHVFPSNSILCIFEDSQNRLWAGTDKGLIQFDGSKGWIKTITFNEGLPVNFVVGISEDASGCLWLSTTKGLCKYHPESEEIQTFNTKHGLVGNSFSMGAAFKGPDEKIYFGGTEGLVAFQPQNTKNILPPLTPIFVKHVINNQETWHSRNLSYTSEIVIKPDENFFSIEVSALDYLFNQDVRFKYRIKSLTKQWHDLDKNRMITFSKLKPSKYELEIQATNNNVDWIECEKPLKIIVKPTLIQNRVFQLFLLVFFSICLVFFLRLRTKYFRQQETRLKSQVDLQTLEIRKSAEKLKEANQTKEKFFSILAHDLRSPFNSLLGLADILESNWENQPEQKKQEQVSIIKQNLEKVYNLVDNLLKWSRIQQNRIVPDIKTLKMKTLIDQAIDEVQAPALLKEIVVKNQVHENTMVQGDELMIATVLRNLLSNAIKYSYNNSSIILSCKVDDKKVITCVEDFGTGISEERQKDLFSLIKSKSEPGTKGEKGTGLGLIITREFIDLLGGSFEFSSKTGKGSKFCFCLKEASTK